MVLKSIYWRLRSKMDVLSKIPILNFLLILISMYQCQTETVHLKIKTRSTLNIIKEYFHHLDITIVNSKQCRDENIQDIYELGSNAIIQRAFNTNGSKIYHAAYLICSDNNAGLSKGLQKLSFDFFWNPNKRFIIFLDSVEAIQIYETFKLLKYYEITNVVVIIGNYENQKKIYAYVVPDGTGCEFSGNYIISTDTYEESNSSLALFRNKVKRDFSDCNVTILSNYRPPFGFMNGSNLSEILTGLCDVFLKIMKQTADYNFTIVSEHSLEFGVVMPNRTVTGLLKRIDTRDMDGAASGMLLNWNRLQLFDFTTPHLPDQFIIVVPKAPLVQRWKSLFLVYDTNTWLLIFVAYVIYPPLAMHFRIFNDLNDRLIYKDYYFICFGYILSMPNSYTSSDVVSRMLLMFWIIFTWFVNVCFLSVLASVVTAPIQLHQINTIAELKQNHYEFHVNKNAFLQVEKLDKIQEVIINPIHCATAMACLKVVAGGGKKFTIVSASFFDFYKYNFVDENGRELLYDFDEPCFTMWITTYVRKGLPVLNWLRSQELKLVQAGIADKTFEDLVYSKILKIKYNDRENQTTFTLTDLYAAYGFLVLGWVVATIRFFWEMYTAKSK